MGKSLKLVDLRNREELKWRIWKWGRNIYIFFKLLEREKIIYRLNREKKNKEFDAHMNNKLVKKDLCFFIINLAKTLLRLVWMLLIIRVEVKCWTNFSNDKGNDITRYEFFPLSSKVKIHPVDPLHKGQETPTSTRKAYELVIFFYLACIIIDQLFGSIKFHRSG